LPSLAGDIGLVRSKYYLEPSKAIAATVKLPNAGKLRVATPEEPEGRNTDGTLEIPARSAAVVMEQ